MKKDSIKKILIFRFGALGDVVHSSELFRSLKRLSKNTIIHYLTFKNPSLLIQNDPDLDEIKIAKGKSYKDLLPLAKELKKENYDLVINLQPSLRTRFFVFLIGAKFNLTYKKDFNFHAVENFWQSAKPLFPEMELNKELYIYIPEEVKEKVKEFATLPENYIVFNIGTSGTRQGRKWPIEYWAELAEKMKEKYGCEIILTGAKEDLELAEQLLKLSPWLKSFCGKFDILENSAVLAGAKIVISGDTGPLHIASATKARCIGLYGAAPVSRTGPYGDKHFAVFSEKNCVPCNRRKCKYLKKGEIYTPCLTAVKAEQIINLVDKNSLME